MVRWWMRRRRSPAPHVFVVGAPRSGTTLMHTVLLAHPHLCGPHGETGFFSWRNLLDPARNVMGLSAAERRPLEAEADDLTTFFDALVRRFKAQHGAEGRRFVEKTPQHVKHLDTIGARFPRARFVHMVRDGRDACCSALKADIPNGDAVDRFGRYWRRCIRARLHTRHADHVSYEAFTSEPEATLRGVMAFLGEAYVPSQLEPAARAHDPRTQVARFARLARPITPASQGRWRRDLAPSQVARFEAIAGDELAAMGYPLAHDAVAV
jgi:hypothetical protein